MRYSLDILIIRYYGKYLIISRMRKFRKTRKTRRRVHRGGVGLVEPNIYRCGTTNYSTCMTNFLTTHNLFRIDIPGDGDCFYRTLSTYGLIMGYRPLNHSPLTLRKIMMNYIFINYDTNYYDPNLPPLSVYFPEGPPGETALQKRQRDLKEIVTLSKPGQWNTDTGDIPMQLAPSLFQINIVITDARPAPGGSTNFNRVTLGAGVGSAYNPALPRIDMLRVGNAHFNLLFPQAEYFGRYYDPHMRIPWMHQGLTEAELQSFVNPTGELGAWVDSMHSAQLAAIPVVNANQRALANEVQRLASAASVPPPPAQSPQPVSGPSTSSKINTMAKQEQQINKNVNRRKKNKCTLKNINMRLNSSND